MLRGEHDKSDRLNSYALDIGAPSRAVYLISIILTCLHSHTSGSARCTLLSQADDELRWSGESTQRASMINAQWPLVRVCDRLDGDFANSPNSSVIARVARMPGVWVYQVYMIKVG